MYKVNYASSHSLITLELCPQDTDATLTPQSTFVCVSELKDLINKNIGFCRFLLVFT